MSDLLNQPVILSELSDEDWQKAKQIKDAKIPSVSFASATLEDCVREDGLALDLRYIEPIAMVPVATLHIPPEIAAPVPSSFLCDHLLKVMKLFVLDNEKVCRMLIDAILLEVLDGEANETLSGFCDVDNDWFGPGFGYTGSTDYMFGFSKTKSVKTMDSFLLVVEAKKEWPDSAMAQVLVEAGCLLKKRLASGNKTPVFAVLTNGQLFRFFCIDVDGVVYSSGAPPIGLGPGPSGDYSTSTSLSEILRWFHWFLTSIKTTSQQASSSEMTDLEMQDSLTKLKCCFGPKQPPPAHDPKVQH
ncbi:hypothetical protein HDV03_001014 [Kappamyces sp. JEL0829]|nr:hypothetical protein HDV03_001014 [Kappamyces sp. JEL0829]